MIKFNNISNETPYQIFQQKYEEGIIAKQKNIEAISISSYSKVYDKGKKGDFLYRKCSKCSLNND